MNKSAMRIRALMLKVAKTSILKESSQTNNAVIIGERLPFEGKEEKKENGQSEYFVYSSGKIKLIKGTLKKHAYYVEIETNQFKLVANLDENQHGLVKFPDSGNGFKRYGRVDKGGGEYGVGDHYLLPGTAAELFGVTNDVHKKGWEIAFGDMSSENGKDPWESGQKHHSGHGGNRGRKGLDIDYRYLDSSGKSYWGYNSSLSFDKQKNKDFLEIVYKYGFGKNYFAHPKYRLGEKPDGVIHDSGHDDHGHIGLSNLDIEMIENINVKKMKKYLILTAVLFYSCNSQNLCFVHSYLANENDYKISFSDFNVFFIDVHSTSIPSEDFSLKKSDNNITIIKNYLESDNLSNKRFIIQSEVLDSISIELIQYSDFVFEGEEKRSEPLNLIKIDTLYVSCEENYFSIPLAKRPYSKKVIQKAYDKNIKYHTKVLNDSSYSVSEREDALKFLETTNFKDYKTIDALFVKEDLLKFTLNFNYYKKGILYKNSLSFYNNELYLTQSADN